LEKVERGGGEKLKGHLRKGLGSNLRVIGGDSNISPRDDGGVKGEGEQRKEEEGLQILGRMLNPAV